MTLPSPTQCPLSMRMPIAHWQMVFVHVEPPAHTMPGCAHDAPGVAANVGTSRTDTHPW